MQEHGLTDYEDLATKVSETTERHNTLSDQLKALDGKLTANAELQKQIAVYAKTHATYLEYRKSGYSKLFRATHEADILLHQTACVQANLACATNQQLLIIVGKRNLGNDICDILPPPNA